MNSEPHDFTTIVRRPITASDKPRTREDYQNDLRRMFGKVPSPQELAKRENAARRGKNPVSNMARPQVNAADHPNTLAAIAATIAKGEATRASILAAMTKPMTCPDVATVLKRTPQLIRRHLGTLAEEGRVVGTKVKGVVVWQLRAEAAE